MKVKNIKFLILFLGTVFTFSCFKNPVSSSLKAMDYTPKEDKSQTTSSTTSNDEIKNCIETAIEENAKKYNCQKDFLSKYNIIQHTIKESKGKFKLKEINKTIYELFEEKDPNIWKNKAEFITKHISSQKLNIIQKFNRLIGLGFTLEEAEYATKNLQTKDNYIDFNKYLNIVKKLYMSFKLSTDVVNKCKQNWYKIINDTKNLYYTVPSVLFNSNSHFIEKDLLDAPYQKQSIINCVGNIIKNELFLPIILKYNKNEKDKNNKEDKLYIKIRNYVDFWSLNRGMSKAIINEHLKKSSRKEKIIGPYLSKLEEELNLNYKEEAYKTLKYLAINPNYIKLENSNIFNYHNNYYKSDNIYKVRYIMLISVLKSLNYTKDEIIYAIKKISKSVTPENKDNIISLTQEEIDEIHTRTVRNRDLFGVSDILKELFSSKENKIAYDKEFWNNAAAYKAYIDCLSYYNKQKEKKDEPLKTKDEIIEMILEDPNKKLWTKDEAIYARNFINNDQKKLVEEPKEKTQDCSII